MSDATLNPTPIQRSRRSVESSMRSESRVDALTNHILAKEPCITEILANIKGLLARTK